MEIAAVAQSSTNMSPRENRSSEDALGAAGWALASWVVFVAIFAAALAVLFLLH
jgi:hypothetical protein